MYTCRKNLNEEYLFLKISMSIFTWCFNSLHYCTLTKINILSLYHLYDAQSDAFLLNSKNRKRLLAYPILTRSTKEVNPSQQVLTCKWQDDKGNLSRNVGTEPSSSQPLHKQDNSKGQVQKENNKDDGVNKTWRTRISSSDTDKEVTNDNEPCKEMGDES